MITACTLKIACSFGCRRVSARWSSSVGRSTLYPSSDISKAEPLPFDMSLDGYNVDLPTELDHRALTLRHPKLQAIFKVQAVIIDSFREFMKSQDFFEFQAPSIVPATAEGGAEVFKVKYFDKDAYLSQ